MSVIGLMMVVLTRLFGHSYVDGVGYSVIQSIMDQKLTGAGLLALLFVLKMVATTVSLLGETPPAASSRRRFILALRSAHRLRGRHRFGAAAHRSCSAVGGHHRHGGDGRRGNRRRHDGDCHGVRYDAGLRHHRSRHRRGGACRRHPARADQRGRSTPSSCAIAATAFPRSGTSTSSWSGRRRTSWSRASSWPRQERP